MATYSAKFFNPTLEGGIVNNRYVLFEDNENPYARHEMKMRNLGIHKAMFEIEKKELSETLKRLSEQERDKERIYLNKKIDAMMQGQETPLATKLRTIFNGRKPYYISTLFTQLLATERQLKVMKSMDIKKYDILKATVFERNFNEYFKKYLNAIIDGKRFRKTQDLWLNQFINNNLSFDRFIKEFINHLFSEFNESEVPDINELKQTYLEGLTNGLIDKYGEDAKSAIPMKWLINQNPLTKDDVVKFLYNVDFKHDVKVRKGSKDPIKTIINKLALNVFNGVALELEATAALQSKGKAIHTGNIKEKADILFFDMEGTVVSKFTLPPISDIVDVRAQDKINQYVDNMLKVMKDMGIDGTVISVSAKDYRSNFQFNIHSGSRRSVVAQINKLADELQGQLNIEEFAFLLNNTIVGAFMENKQDEVYEALGYLCAAFMFDDIENIFKSESSDNILHLYNIGGTYFSLSELLNDAADKVLGISADSLIKVQAGKKDNIVSDMKQTYRRSEVWPGLEVLKERWIDVRDDADVLELDIKMNREVIKSAALSIRKLLPKL